MMTFDDKRLEQIAANEAWLAQFPSPRPGASLVARIKACSRGAAYELWLASCTTPGPGAATIAEVKAAVREEIRAGRSRSIIARAIGVLSAAAMIGLAVGVVRFAPVESPDLVVSYLEPEKLFLESLNAVMASDTKPLEAIEQALTTLETAGVGSSPDWDLDDLGEEIDNLITDPGNTSLLETS